MVKGYATFSSTKDNRTAVALHALGLAKIIAVLLIIFACLIVIQASEYSDTSEADTVSSMGINYDKRYVDDSNNLVYRQMFKQQSSEFILVICGVSDDAKTNGIADFTMGETATINGKTYPVSGIMIEDKYRLQHYGTLTISCTNSNYFISLGSFSENCVIDNLIYNGNATRCYADQNHYMLTTYGNAISQTYHVFNGKINNITIGSESTALADSLFSSVKTETDTPTPVTFSDRSTSLEIKQYALQNCSIQNDLPDCTLTIRKGAFDGAIGLTSITIRDRFTLEEGSFINFTSLTNAVLNDARTTIPVSLFEGTGLTTVSLPSSLTSIGNRAFYGTGLTAIILPDTLTSIGTDAFTGTGLTTVTFNGNSAMSSASAKVPSTVKHLILSDTTTVIKTSYFPSSVVLEDVTIGAAVATGLPEFITSNPDVTYTLSPNNDHYVVNQEILCSKTDGHLDVALKYLGSGFSVGVPSGVTTISSLAFQGNTKITYLTIPNSVTTIEANAFKGCAKLAFVDVELDDGLMITSVGANAFDTGYSTTPVWTMLIFIEGDTTDLIDTYISESDKRMWTAAYGTTTVNHIYDSDKANPYEPGYYDSASDENFPCNNRFIFDYENRTLTILEGKDEEGNDITSMVSNAPWGGLKDLVTSLTIGSKITSINQKGVSGFVNLEELHYLATSCSGFGSGYGSNNIFVDNGINSGGYDLYLEGEITRLPFGFMDYQNTDGSKPSVNKIIFNISSGTIQIDNSSFKSLDNVSTIVFDGLANVRSDNMSYFVSFSTAGKALGHCDYIINIDSEFLCGENAYNLGSPYMSLTVGDNVTRFPSIYKGNTTITNVTLGARIATIGNGAFQGCINLATVNTGNVTSIGDNAFSGCSSISSLDLSKSRVIGENAFKGCTSLLSVDLSDVSTIGTNVFQGCTSLRSVILPNTLVRIPSGTFDGCSSLETINLSNVTSISDNAFKGCISLVCPNLSKVTYFGSGAFLGTNEEPLNLGEVDLSSATSFGPEAFAFSGFIGDIGSSSQQCNYSSGSGSGPLGMFQGCDVGIITLNTVDRVYHNLFLGLSDVHIILVKTATAQSFADFDEIGSVTIPAGSKAEFFSNGSSSHFVGCDNLETVTILATSVTIPSNAFSGCGALVTVTLNETTIVGQNAFQNCGMLNTIVGAAGGVDSYAFYGCSNLSNPDLSSCAYIRNYAFRGCSSLASDGYVLTLRNMQIGEGAFSNTNVTKVCMENITGYPAIGTLNPIFTGTGVTDITYSGTTAQDLSNMLSGITADYTLTVSGSRIPVIHDSLKLVGVVIGESVTTGTQNEFQGCENLRSFAFNATGFTYVYTYDNDGLNDNDHGGPLFGIPGPVALTIGSNVTTIPAYMFAGCNVTLALNSSSISTIGTSAFQDCTGITSVVLSDNVSVGTNAFSGCTGVTSLVIPRGATIASGAFNGMTGLTAATINAYSGTSIIFSGSGSVTNGFAVTFTENVTAIPNNVLNGSKVSSVTVLGTLHSIGDSAFYGCSALTAAVMPAGGTESDRATIGANAFRYCGNLSEVEFPGQIVIGDYAFDHCAGLTTVKFDGYADLGYHVFQNSGITSVTVPAEYQIRSSGWTDLSTLRTVNIQKVGDGVCPNSDGLYQPWSAGSGVTVNIGTGVTTLGDRMFLGAASVTNINLGDITSIGAECFRNSGLTSVTIPAGVTVIGNGAFANLAGTASISVEASNAIYESVDGVLYTKGEFCTLVQYPAGKTDVTFILPDGVSSVGTYAFEGSAHLQKFVGNRILQNIGNYAFRNCTNNVEFVFFCNPGANAYAFKEGVMFMDGETELSLSNLGPYTYRYDSEAYVRSMSVMFMPGEHAVSSTPTIVDVADGHVASLPVDTKADYYFRYWYTSGYSSAFNFADPVTQNIILTAKITTKPIEVTIYANGGDANTSVTFYLNDSDFENNSVDRAGYEFEGYFTAAVGGLKVIDSFRCLVASVDGYVDESGNWIRDESDLVLYAQWSPVQYDILIDANGGVADTDGSVAYDSTTVSITAPVWVGHRALGYYTAAVDGEKVIDPNGNLVASVVGYTDADGKWIRDSDAELYAHWELVKYTILFMNGDAVVAELLQDYGTTVTAPADPVKEGYSFAGWDDDVPATVPSENVTLHATWNINQYTATVTLAGGSVAQTPAGWTFSNGTYTKEFDFGTTSAAIESSFGSVSREGYSFSSWSASADTLGTSGMSIDATWTINQYVASITLDGGSVAQTPAGWTFSNGAYTKQFDFGTTAAAIESSFGSVSREGYSFAGWSATPDVLGTSGMTLNATWVINQYTVTFMNGELVVSSSTDNYGTAVSTPADPTKEGYTFAGWDKTVPETVPAGNVVLNATWTINQYTATVTLAGGSVAQTPAGWTFSNGAYTKEFDFGTTATAIESSFGPVSREGYSFSSWSATSDVLGISGMSIDATWTINQYTATVTLAGGSVAQTPAGWTFSNGAYTKEFNFGTSVDDIESSFGPVSREGYSFSSWSATSDVLGISGMSIDATWTINQYTATVALAGGSVVQVPAGWAYADGVYTKQFNFGTTATAIESSFGSVSREGYTFSSWSATSDVLGTSGMTVTAQWTINQYTVTFMDGESVLSAITQNYGTAVNAPTNPSKEGHSFTGWDGDVPATVPSSDMVLHAIWAVNEYTITFMDGESVLSTITQDYGTAVNAPADPSKEGYTFAGWDKTVPRTIPAGNVSLLAQWAINQYTVTFMDGESVLSTITQDYGTAVTAPTDPAKVGHTFAGWDKTVPATVPAENTTLNARWTVDSYTISFNANGGTGSMVDLVIVYDADGIALPQNGFIAPANKEFLGWSTSENGVSLTGKLVVESDTTVYAVWGFSSIDIAFDANGGTGTMAPVTYTRGQELALTTAFSREHYSFAGWNTAADGSGTTYENGADANLLPAGCTLYAQWDIDTFTVTYMLDRQQYGESEVYDWNSTVTVRPVANVLHHTASAWTAEGITVTDGTFVIGFDVVFSAVTTPVDYGYIVNFVSESGRVLADAFNGTAPYGSSIEVRAVEVPGYTCSVTVQNIAIGAEGNSATFTYVPVTYTVEYVWEGEMQGENPVSFTIESETLTLYAAIDGDRIFAGWFTSSDAVEKVESIVSGTIGNLVLYPAWASAPVIDNGKAEISAEEGKDFVAIVVDEELTNNAEVLDVSFGDIGTISIPMEVLSEVTESVTVTMKVADLEELEPEVLEKVGDGMLFTLSTSFASDFGDNLVTVTLAYSLPDGQEYKVVKVYWLKENGETEEFDAEYADGFVTFQTPHFSDWIIRAENPEKIDITIDGETVSVDFGAVFGETVRAPAREGYTFAGWFSDSACTVAFDTSTVMDHVGITVFTKYTENPAPEPEPSGGKGGMCSSTIALIVISMLAVAVLPVVRYVRL